MAKTAVTLVGIKDAPNTRLTEDLFGYAAFRRKCSSEVRHSYNFTVAKADKERKGKQK